MPQRVSRISLVEMKTSWTGCQIKEPHKKITVFQIRALKLLQKATPGDERAVFFLKDLLLVIVTLNTCTGGLDAAVRLKTLIRAISGINS